MRDVFPSDPFELIASFAIDHGVLITRNRHQPSFCYLETSQLDLLSRKLDEQKRHFLSQINSQVETYVEEGAGLSGMLPKEIQDALKKYVSLSLSHLECYLREFSVCDVRPEILLAWLEPDSSSSPSSAEQHPADSYSAGRTGSVSGHACDQSGRAMHDGPAEQEERHDRGGFPSPTDDELRKHGCPALVEPRARTFLCQLPDSDLAAINAGVIPTPLMKLMGRVAYDELERRRDDDA